MLFLVSTVVISISVGIIVLVLIIFIFLIIRRRRKIRQKDERRTKERAWTETINPPPRTYEPTGGPVPPRGGILHNPQQQPNLMNRQHQLPQRQFASSPLYQNSSQVGTLNRYYIMY